MMNSPAKKGIGYCREKARNVVRDFEKENGKVSYPIPITQIAVWSGFKVEYLNTLDDAHSALTFW